MSNDESIHKYRGSKILAEHCPPEYCPKCGSHSAKDYLKWEGPNYRYSKKESHKVENQLTHEWLSWVCLVCGYQLRTLCNDSKKPSGRASLFSKKEGAEE
jgi:hypothetical protein